MREATGGCPPWACDPSRPPSQRWPGGRDFPLVADVRENQSCGRLERLERTNAELDQLLRAALDQLQQMRIRCGELEQAARENDELRRQLAAYATEIDEARREKEYHLCNLHTVLHSLSEARQQGMDVEILRAEILDLREELSARREDGDNAHRRLRDAQASVQELTVVREALLLSVKELEDTQRQSPQNQNLLIENHEEDRPSPGRSLAQSAAGPRDAFSEKELRQLQELAGAMLEAYNHLQENFVAQTLAFGNFVADVRGRQRDAEEALRELGKSSKELGMSHRFGRRASIIRCPKQGWTDQPFTLR